jgi:hypothetical protein
MKRMLFSRLFFLVVLAGAGLVLGCGQKDVSLAPVSGKVTVDGQPLTSGSVSLLLDVPLGNEGAKEASKAPTAGLSGGKIGPDGTYKIYTGGKEGAPLGKYKVRVIPPQTETKKDKDAKEAPDIGYNKKYTDANKTPLHIEVVASPQPGAYDLKLTK